MRRYLYVAMGAASALLIAAPTAQAGVAHSNPASASHVLTISKLHGKAVKVNATLKASLATGKTVTISIAGSSTQKMTCKKASFTLKVLTNPTAKGTATMSVTSEKLSRCKINVNGITVKSVVAENLPYAATASDAKGDPVKVTGSLQFTATVIFAHNPIVCSYDAASSTGHASNKHHTVTFKGQKFTEDAGDGGFCLAGPAALSATFGPIRDTSVAHSPIVFVN